MTHIPKDAARTCSIIPDGQRSLGCVSIPPVHAPCASLTPPQNVCLQISLYIEYPVLSGRAKSSTSTKHKSSLVMVVSSHQQHLTHPSQPTWGNSLVKDVCKRKQRAMVLVPTEKEVCGFLWALQYTLRIQCHNKHWKRQNPKWRKKMLCLLATENPVSISFSLSC